VLRAYLRALWPAEPPAIATLPPGAERPVLAAGALHLPRAGPQPQVAQRLRLASAAHAGAHLAHGGPRQDRAALRPVQLALVGLLEDARVEWLAARELPGLRALWLGFHRAGPDGGSDLESLMARLARVLLDPRWPDPHPWVRKGRGLFFADAEGRVLALRDAASVRRAASLLGNDVGQMRVQFNPRLYRVQPEYRDDNAHLWTFDATLPPAARALQAAESVGARFGAGEGGATGDGHDPFEREAPAGSDREADTGPATVGAEVTAAARPSADTAPAAADGTSVARHPEWDRLIGRHRPAWTTVIEGEPTEGADAQACRALSDALEREAALARRLRSLLRADGVLRARLRPQRAAEGDDFHLGALVDAGVARRMRVSPDPRVHLRAERGDDRLAVSLLVDASASTGRAAGAGGSTVLDVARLAALACADALAAHGHACAVHAFASDGRHAVRLSRVLDFGETAGDPRVLERAAALRSGLSTRIGAALRHAGGMLAGRREARRLVLLLTDGEPHDVDVHDSRYLLDDMRVAVGELARRGVVVACLNLDAAAHAARRDALRRAFPAGTCAEVTQPARLAEAIAAALAAALR
jgi:hypothetical protein